MIKTIDKIIEYILNLRRSLGIKYNTNKALNRALKNYSLKRLTLEQKKEIRDYYISSLGRKPNIGWCEYFISANHCFDTRFITMDILYGMIVPKLNDINLRKGWQDKNITNLLLPSIPQPKTILKNLNGNYFDMNNCPIRGKEAFHSFPDGSYIIKPSLDTGGGKSVKLLQVKNSKLSNGDDLETYVESVFKHNFIIQEKLEQHPDIAKFNPTSLNTIRYLTYRDSSKKIYPLSAVLRIGRLGEVVDNGSAGGMFCGINLDGSLKDFALTFPLSESLGTSDTGEIFKGSSIPNFNLITDEITCWHELLPYFDIVAWDIAINNQGLPVLIEFNIDAPGINLLQLANGPIFGEHTEDVLQRVRANR